MSTYTPTEALAFKALHGFDPRTPTPAAELMEAHAIAGELPRPLRDQVTTAIYKRQGLHTTPDDMVAELRRRKVELPPRAKAWVGEVTP